MAVVGVGVAPVGVGCGGATPPKERDSGAPFGVQTARRRISIGAECWRGVRDSAPSRKCRPGGWHPLRPQRYRRAIGPGRIGPQAVLPPIFLDAPELVGGSGAAGERIGVKNPPRARPAVEADVRTQIPSAPAPSRHRKSIKETPLPFIPRDAQPLPYLHASTDLGGVHSSERRSASYPPFPENLRPSTRHRAPVLPSILTSTKQRVNKKACQHNKGFAKQHNSKTRGA